MDSNVFVALLRGINVGGKNPLDMAKLRIVFEQLGFSSVKTYINSGNVIFQVRSRGEDELRSRIEAAIKAEFGLAVPAVLRSREAMKTLVDAVPRAWVNGTTMKCDVMFLWPQLDRPEIVEQIPHKPELEDVVYFPGALVWRVDRDKVTRGQVLRIIGTDTYRQMTVRNVNTVRKLNALMQDM